MKPSISQLLGVSWPPLTAPVSRGHSAIEVSQSLLGSHCMSENVLKGGEQTGSPESKSWIFEDDLYWPLQEVPAHRELQIFPQLFPEASRNKSALQRYPSCSTCHAGGTAVWQPDCIQSKSEHTGGDPFLAVPVPSADPGCCWPLALHCFV